MTPAHAKLLKKLKANPKVKNPEALAAWIGRRVAAKRRGTTHIESTLFDRVVGESVAAPVVKVGDTVTRRGGTMLGEVLAVKLGSYSGGSRASVKVRWANGHTSILADQQLLRVTDHSRRE